uniref:transposase n=1 Tax=Emticicia fluvialis TaxID=2974474 RepID=UPI00286A2CCF
EAVFGQMKSNNKFSRFTLRGLQKVGIEFGLMAIGHNLRKWASKRLSEQENQQNSVPTAQNKAIYVLFESYQIKYRYAA